MSSGRSKAKSCRRIQMPFAVDRNGCNSLSDQVAEGFRKAIRSGHYRPGDVLPSRTEIARALGISVRIPREAMAILAAENLIRPRRGVGCSVMAARETLWNGRFFIVERHASDGSYFFGTMMSEVRKRLSNARFLYSYLSTSRKPTHRHGHDANPIKEALLDKYDAALAICPDEPLTRLLRKKLPTITVDGAPSDADAIHSCGGKVPREMLERCQAAGISNILYVDINNSEDEARKMRRRGFKVEHLKICRQRHVQSLEELERKSFELCVERFARQHRRPELIYFGDDYLARGGLTALLAQHVSVPDEVKVVTMSNKGFAPAFPVTLARYEYDPVAFGAYVADCLIAKREGRAKPEPPEFRQYIPGDSFPDAPMI
ncbi:MAG: GntR family transcriptional regulator [Kiritimatiellae bacterium]|nr:GntR family transcriptional regulator [Kiritimatiellia bacterium]